MFSDTEATSNIGGQTYTHVLKLYSEKKKKTKLLNLGKHQSMQELWELGSKWEETAKECPGGGNIRKNNLGPASKSLECYAKNFGLYPSGCQVF